ncbi:MAG: phage shock protein operon transcriptional activator [Deltaproteobacteria bacterium]|nr:phage shock protein operon transcriptional activator [Deltaproteobacteria bacterium]
MSRNRLYDSTPPSKSMVSTVEALGQSESFLGFQEQLSRVAAVERPVLLLGERGTGKELAATRLHYLSGRWQGPLVTLNCAALTPSLIETELFGHEKGAFTGAQERRKGRFETAAGGTLFLDEVGNIPLEAQEKILRVVEYGCLERVGGTESLDVDVRILSATNADLLKLAAEGRFKQDLLDRLSFEVLFLPPLRERKGDILFLAEHFAGRMALELGREETPRFNREVKEKLEAHSWPGNIRELKSAVERAVYRSGSSLIREVDLNPFRSAPPGEGLPAPPKSHRFLNTVEPERDLLSEPFEEAVKEFEIRMIERALTLSRFNQRKAAKALGLTYHQFRGLVRKYRGQLDGGS